MKYLIIGASGGIGKKIAEILSREPENQLILTYNKHPIQEFPSATKIQYNVLENHNPFENLNLSSLDGLVYTPGAILLKPFDRISPEEFKNDFELQVLGAAKTIQYVLKYLKQSQKASIVLFSTVATKIGMSFHSLVSTSKSAIEGLTLSLAAEFAPHIRVNCIAPSITNTPLASGFLNTEQKVKNLSDRHPLKRIGSPEDIAELTVFLLSPKSSWITGQVIPVDGGMSTIRNF
ncbi:MAG: SDR family oxidoreductase [Leptospiraceae bacterium]|nr:SDR family oxidoreductase [Leptospiraceae bacterium]MDW7976265.1 SDR family oxidoreductase [Leptospiraceae bacterium]